MLELKGNAISLWIDNKEVARNFFEDKELNGPKVFVVVDFDKTDGDLIHYFGYDELPLNEPVYKPIANNQRTQPTTTPAPAPAAY